MQNFEYIALNTENQQLKGIIGAEDSRKARQKLHDMGLSVVVLNETDKTPSSAQNTNTPEEGLQSFEFFVMDGDGKSLNGTIEAVDKKNAFRRLVSEYNFDVVSLASTALPQEVRFEEGKKGIAEMSEEVESEFGVRVKGPAATGDESQLDDLVGSGFQEERKMLMVEIDIIVSKTNELLKDHSDKLPPEAIDDTRKYLDELMRLKLSNNLSLIRRLSEDLFLKVDDLIEEFINREDDERIKELREAIKEGEEYFEKSQKTRSFSYKSVTKSLQMLSSKLDKVMGKQGKKKDSANEGKRSALVMFGKIERVFRMFGMALFTPNATLRKQRLGEAQKMFLSWKEEWNKFFATSSSYEEEEKRKTLRDVRRDHVRASSETGGGNISNTKIEEEEDDLIFVPESDFVSVFLREVHFFLGTLLFLGLAGVFLGDIIITYRISPFLEYLEKIQQGDLLLLLLICVFFLYIFLTIREKLFWGKTMMNFLLFSGVVGVMYMYVINF